jgi:nitrogen-specific signal transduction histidine kinase
VSCHGFDVPVVNDDKILFDVLCLAIDASNRRRLEEHLVRAQKLEILGRTAAGFVHDFKNLLTVISGYCELLLSSSERSASDRELLEGIQKVGQRCSSLAHHLLDFGRRRPEKNSVVNLSDVVQDNAGAIRRILGDRVELEILLDRSASTVYADFGAMEQLLLNLVINAKDAMPCGGVLKVQTIAVQLNPGSIQEHLAVGAGRYVRWSVSDSGTGMSREIKKRIFEPFFTTKAPGDGSGLGLAMVQEVVESCGGCVDVVSEVDKGTTFHLYFPYCDLHAADHRGAQGCSDAPKTILLVEERDDERTQIRRALQAGEFVVFEARNAREAVEVCAATPQSIGLLVVDAATPGVAGADLAEQLRLLAPQLKVLYVSSAAAPRSTPTTAEGTHCLRRPFTFAALVEAAGAILEKR